MRVVHEDAQVRGGVPHRISRLGPGALAYWRVPGSHLQSKATALSARLLPTGRVRARPASQKGRRFAAAYWMSFLRHQEIFPSDGGACFAADAPAHRLDEFPAGYSLAGCAPAEPASASPAGHHFEVQASRCTMTFQATASCRLTGCLSRGVHRTAWVNAIKQQCDEQESLFFFKQWGGVQKAKLGRRLN